MGQHREFLKSGRHEPVGARVHPGVGRGPARKGAGFHKPRAGSFPMQGLLAEREAIYTWIAALALPFPSAGDLPIDMRSLEDLLDWIENHPGPALLARVEVYLSNGQSSQSPVFRRPAEAAAWAVYLRRCSTVRSAQCVAAASEEVTSG